MIKKRLLIVSCAGGILFDASWNSYAQLASYGKTTIGDISAGFQLFYDAAGKLPLPQQCQADSVLYFVAASNKDSLTLFAYPAVVVVPAAPLPSMSTGAIQWLADVCDYRVENFLDELPTTIHPGLCAIGAFPQRYPALVMSFPVELNVPAVFKCEHPVTYHMEPNKSYHLVCIPFVSGAARLVTYNSCNATSSYEERWRILTSPHPHAIQEGPLFYKKNYPRTREERMLPTMLQPLETMGVSMTKQIAKYHKRRAKAMGKFFALQKLTFQKLTAS